MLRLLLRWRDRFHPKAEKRYWKFNWKALCQVIWLCMTFLTTPVSTNLLVTSNPTQNSKMPFSKCFTLAILLWHEIACSDDKGHKSKQSDTVEPCSECGSILWPQSRFLLEFPSKSTPAAVSWPLWPDSDLKIQLHSNKLFICVVFLLCLCLPTCPSRIKPDTYCTSIPTFPDSGPPLRVTLSQSALHIW